MLSATEGSTPETTPQQEESSVTQNLERPGAPAALRPQQRNEDEQSPANRPARPRRRSRSLWFGPMAIVAVAFLIYQLPPYLAMDSSQSRIPLKFPLHYAILVGHVLFGSLSLVTMCLQMWPWLRRTHPVFHRWSGRVYLWAGALPSAALALIMFPVAFKAGSIGVLMSASLWSYFGVMGWVRARQRRWREHRKYMLYSFAVMWGQVIWGFALGMSWIWFSPWVAEVDFNYIAETARWVGWVSNLLVVQWWLDKTAKRPLDM
jgi:hypothetical protein